MKTFTAAVLLLSSLTAHAIGQTHSYSLDPKSTFLRSFADVTLAPTVLDLTQLGIAPGQWLRVGTHGNYSHYHNGPDDHQSLIGVFSASATLQATNVTQRVPDAIVAGGQYVSGNTYNGNYVTDITQDLFASRRNWRNFIDVEVPAGATHLFLGVHDTLYHDNTDPDGDFGCDVTVLPQPSLPGTGEHVELRSTASGGTPDELDVQPASPGSVMVSQLTAPTGFVDNQLFVFVADTKATGATSPQLLPSLWMGNLLVVHFGFVGTDLSWSDSFSLTAPAGLAGTTLVIQAGVLTSIARNGTYQMTHAHQFELQ